MMKRLSVLALVFAMLAAPAMAADCYTPEQYRAEQAIRFHTRLMVMGLYCKAVLQQNTYGTYQDFTRRNQNVIRAEENRLIAHFKQTKSPNAEKSLHSLRTDLANKMSIQAGSSVVSFCRQYQENLQQAKAMIPADFQRWVEKADAKQFPVSTRPVCAAAQRAK